MASTEIRVHVEGLPKMRERLTKVAAMVNCYRTALAEIAKETGTPYARIAQAALDAYPTTEQED